MSRRIILSRQYCTPFCNKSGIERFFSTFLFLAGNRLLRAHFELQCSYTLPKLSEVRTVNYITCRQHPRWTEIKIIVSCLRGCPDFLYFIYAEIYMYSFCDVKLSGLLITSHLNSDIRLANEHAYFLQQMYNFV